MNFARHWLLIVSFFLLVINAHAETPTPPGKSATFSVTDYGAVGDGKTLCTAAIQQAIDTAASAGGGTVRFPPGVFLSGTLFLKSRVTLHLEAGATLFGSPNVADYPARPAKIKSRTNLYNLRSLIFAEDLEQIAVTGRGTLDGNGKAFPTRNVDGSKPLILRIINCRDVLVENVRMQSSGFWNQHYQACERVQLRGLRIWNHDSYNADGIDLDACRDVVVSDCFIDSDDDAICLKSTFHRPCENVLVSNCVLSSHCNSLKMGTDSTGGFVNVTITNCSIISPRRSKNFHGLQRGRCGIALEIVDGGRMNQIAVSNVTIDGVEVPIFVRLGARGRGYLPSHEDPEVVRASTGLITDQEPEPKEKVPVGALRNVSLENIIATRAGKSGSLVAGLPGHCIENLTLSNVSLCSEGGGERHRASTPIPESPGDYPEATMFGHLPSHGLYCRHVRGLTLSNVRLQTDEPDPRHALVLDDVQAANVSGLVCSYTPDAAPLVRLTETRNVLIRGCQPNAPQGVFIRLEGRDTTGVALIGNDLSRVGKTAELAEDAAADALHTAGNLEPQP
ncbi:MAG: glycoside hydrolase family 28 protein [Pirellulales bacterium]|nr:glycoside hydrolase family 28 protein [Pirellulales bacterium]